jgi:DNA-directed DNA polymerase III PolC
MHLHLHTNYSFLAGTLPVAHAVDLAMKEQYSALAITNTNTVSGVTEFYTLARSKGIKPIIGCELRTGNYRATVLAKNWKGYQHICEMVKSIAVSHPPARIVASEQEGEAPGEESPDNDDGKILCKVLCMHDTDDIIVLSRDEEILKALKVADAKACLYIELIKADEAKWTRLLDLSEKLSIPLVATNDVYFGSRDGWKLHRILRAISTNSLLTQVPASELADQSQYFCGEEEFRSWFHFFPEALQNRQKIVEACEVVFDFKKSKFTEFNNGRKSEKLGLLTSLAEEGFRNRYPEATMKHIGRFEKERSIIAELGFVDYFLVAWDVVRYAKHKNYPYVGRGSGANSLLAYCLEITNVDPIELDLFFERFLNPERKSPPDFDIDFSWRNRDDVIDYVLKKYGEERTAMIGTISTFNPRGALREVGKVLGFSEAEIKQFTSMMPAYGATKDLIDPASPFSRQSAVALASSYGRDWVTIATRILDFPNHYGIHSGGVILAPEKLTRYTATQVAPKGVRITQQDMFEMDAWHLEKMDILSTRGLGTFEDTMRAVEVRTGALPPILDYHTACNDERTKEIMRTGKTIGCFYVESPAMIQLLKKLRADSFEMLTAASSIIRPGVSQSGMMQAFIERFHDPSKIRPPHPLMAELLKTTFGVMVYQEDVIKVAHYIANLSLGEADLLRRAMSGKMRSKDAMRQLRERFNSGCAERGIPESAAAEIWRQMESFAGYSFCKAHSASYAVLSFQEAYLKSHYPAIFLCSVLNNQGGYYRPDVYIQEAKRLNLRILLPSVNDSEELHTCPDDATIQLGFLHIKGLSQRSVSALLRARHSDGAFNGFHDLINRSGITFEDLCILVRCGACDCFQEKRSELLVKARLLLHGSKDRRRGGELPLEFPDFKEDLAHLRAYTPEQVTQIELETFSYAVSTHVLSHFDKELKGTVLSKDIARSIGKRVTVGGWMVSAKMSRTKKGERMMFMNLDDSTGMIDVVLFPRCYNKYAHLLRTTGPYKILGRVAEEFGVVNVIAETVERIIR